MVIKIKVKFFVYLLICLVIAVPVSAAEEIIVSAAASLTNVMEEIRQAFETQNPGITVTCNFASSGSLVQQMVNGAPVDVFASASVNHMDRAEAKGLIDSRTKKIFAANELVVIVPAQSDVSINDVSDLKAENFKKIAVGHPESVPAGRYAKQFLEENKMWNVLYDRLVYTNSVRQVLDYVRRGETDAGFVYKTDVVIGGDKVKTKLDAGKSLNILYPIAVTRMTKHPLSALKFCEFVNGPAGRKILSTHGFNDPE
jgi:molybdate transport system substrate-binding protein